MASVSPAPRRPRGCLFLQVTDLWLFVARMCRFRCRFRCRISSLRNNLCNAMNAVRLTKFNGFTIISISVVFLTNTFLPAALPALSPTPGKAFVLRIAGRLTLVRERITDFVLPSLHYRHNSRHSNDERIEHNFASGARSWKMNWVWRELKWKRTLFWIKIGINLNHNPIKSLFSADVVLWRSSLRSTRSSKNQTW